jgi:predicted histone-like DNA-binding protein
MGAIYALVEVIMKSLSNGQTVRLGDIGSLRVSISSEGKEKEEDISPAAIKKSKIIYSPGKRLKQMLNTLEYKKEKALSRQHRSD